MGSSLKVIRLDGVCGCPKVVLSAAFGSKVVVSTRVLGDLKVNKNITHSIHPTVQNMSIKLPHNTKINNSEYKKTGI